jgi:two-component system response regulator
MGADLIELLVAEDNPSDAELILESLARHADRDRIHVVHDGEEALAFLFCRGVYVARSMQTPPRLVFLDVKLPKIGGLDVLREMKAHARTRPIPVVMLTSSNIERDVATAYRTGANSYVQKPVDFERFRDTVRLLGAYWLTVNEPPPDSVFDVVDT